MKKIVVMGLITLGSISCKKEYTCTCTYTHPSAEAEQTTITPIDKTIKEDAEDFCYNHLVNVSYAGLNPTCTLNKK